MTRRKKGASKLVWFLSCSVFPCSSNNVKSNFFGRSSVVCPTADKRPMQRRTHAARYHLTYKLDFFFSQDLGKFPFILYSQRADLSTTTKEPSEQKKKSTRTDWLVRYVIISSYKKKCISLISSSPKFGAHRTRLVLFFRCRNVFKKLGTKFRRVRLTNKSCCQINIELFVLNFLFSDARVSMLLVDLSAFLGLRVCLCCSREYSKQVVWGSI